MDERMSEVKEGEKREWEREESGRRKAREEKVLVHSPSLVWCVVVVELWSIASQAIVSSLTPPLSLPHPLPHLRHAVLYSEE